MMRQLLDLAECDDRLHRHMAFTVLSHLTTKLIPDIPRCVSVRETCRVLGIRHRGTVRKALALLEALEYIRRDRRGALGVGYYTVAVVRDGVVALPADVRNVVRASQRRRERVTTEHGHGVTMLNAKPIVNAA
jgi:hypothetical protein